MEPNLLTQLVILLVIISFLKLITRWAKTKNEIEYNLLIICIGGIYLAFYYFIKAII